MAGAKCSEVGWQEVELEGEAGPELAELCALI